MAFAHDDGRGLDEYEPITGGIRSNATDEIAGWFIDSDHNEESLLVRNACFTGAADPTLDLLAHHVPGHHFRATVVTRRLPDSQASEACGCAAWAQ